MAEEADKAGWRHVARCMIADAIEQRIAEAILAERRACAAIVDCGCPQSSEVVAVVATQGHNSAARWRLCGDGRCGAIAAWEIRTRTKDGLFS